VSLCPQLRRLSADHARWLAELDRPAGADGAGGRLLALWDAEIQPHCRAEEEVLLPDLARRLSEADAVVVFTLGDHLVLRRLVRDLRSATGPSAAVAAAAVAGKLAEHVRFEERTLLPALQETLGCGRLAELLGELSQAGHSESQSHRGSQPQPRATMRRRS
jgi:hypothetical protein